MGLLLARVDPVDPGKKDAPVGVLPDEPMAISSEPFMRPRRPSRPPPGGPRDDLAHAEGSLHDLARELLRVPMGGLGRALHVRALDLKRRLQARHEAAQGEAPPSLSEEFEELARLR